MFGSNKKIFYYEIRRANANLFPPDSIEWPLPSPTYFPADETVEIERRYWTSTLNPQPKIQQENPKDYSSSKKTPLETQKKQGDSSLKYSSNENSSEPFLKGINSSVSARLEETLNNSTAPGNSKKKKQVTFDSPETDSQKLNTAFLLSKTDSREDQSKEMKTKEKEPIFEKKEGLDKIKNFYGIKNQKIPENEKEKGEKVEANFSGSPEEVKRAKKKMEELQRIFVKLYEKKEKLSEEVEFISRATQTKNEAGKRKNEEKIGVPETKALEIKKNERLNIRGVYGWKDRKELFQEQKERKKGTEEEIWEDIDNKLSKVTQDIEKMHEIVVDICKEGETRPVNQSSQIFKQGNKKKIFVS